MSDDVRAAKCTGKEKGREEVWLQILGEGAKKATKSNLQEERRSDDQAGRSNQRIIRNAPITLQFYLFEAKGVGRSGAIWEKRRTEKGIEGDCKTKVKRRGDCYRLQIGDPGHNMGGGKQL